MDGPEEIGESNFARRTRQHVTPFFAPDATDDVMRLQFEQDLDKVTGWQAVFGREVFDFKSFAGVIMTREAHDGPRGVITFNRQFHGRKVGQRDRLAQQESGMKPCLGDGF